MDTIFRTVLDMSVTGSYVILAVMLVRLLLKRAPKKYSLALWSVAAFRLCCPVSFESVLSLFHLPIFNMSAIQNSYAAQTSSLNYIPEVPDSIPFSTGIYAVNSYFQEATPQVPATSTLTPTPEIDWMAIAAGIWCIGMAVMVLYSLISYGLLSGKLRTAIRLGGNVYTSDAIDSPFILGFLRPKIFLPAGLDGSDREYVLAHERTHLKNRDHLIKLFAYAVLVLHWFNPLCHIAFRLMSGDMEMRCDEAVLARNPEIRKPYSTTLVTLAVKPGAPLPSPLAFGETSVKSRVKNILRWKKPRFWVSITAAGLCLAFLAACAANPARETEPESIFGREYRTFDNVYTIGTYGWSGHYMTSTSSYYCFTEDGELLSYYAGGDAFSHGILKSCELSEESFDAWFPSDAVNGVWNTYSQLFNLREQAVHTWKAEIANTEFDDERTNVSYVLQMENGTLFIAEGFTCKHYEEPFGQMTKLVCVIPLEEANNEPIPEGTYSADEAPTYNSPLMEYMGNYRFIVTDGHILIQEGDNDAGASLVETFLLTDREWTDFPFTEEEWDTITIGGDDAYQFFKGSRYLELSLQYCLFALDGELYVGYGTHDPDCTGANLTVIYHLTTEESID